MNDFTHPDEIKNASEALIRWFESQGITPLGSITIMGMTISTILGELYPKDYREIADKFCDTLLRGEEIYKRKG